MDAKRLAIVLWLVAAPAIAADVAAPFGVYPDCIAPSVPLEQHGWWAQPGESAPRHIHIAACLPNARDTTGALVSISGTQPFTVRITSFNNPDPMNLVRWAWESSVKQNVKGTWDCPGNHGDLNECQWFVPMMLNTTSAKNGLRELRLTENIAKNQFGKRHFGTLNYQLYVKNGTAAGSNYRSKPDPIARSWYTGFDYANVAVNYMDLFKSGQLDRTIPLVSGVVTLKVNHHQTSRGPSSELWIDPDFHDYPEDWANASVGVIRPSGAVLLYRKPGLFDGTYSLDTRSYPNGVHSLYFQTVDQDGTGTHASAMKAFAEFAN